MKSCPIPKPIVQCRKKCQHNGCYHKKRHIQAPVCGPIFVGFDCQCKPVKFKQGKK